MIAKRIIKSVFTSITFFIKKIEPHSIRKGLLLILNDYTNDITEEYTQS